MLILAASLALVNVAHAAPKAPAAAVLEASNPFAKLSTLPFHYPAFDKIKDEHFLPGYAAGMREHLSACGRCASLTRALDVGVRMLRARELEWPTSRSMPSIAP